MSDNLDKYYQQSQVFSQHQAKCYLDHLSLLDIDCEPYSVRHTGIICTIGKFYFFPISLYVSINLLNLLKYRTSLSRCAKNDGNGQKWHEYCKT